VGELMCDDKPRRSKVGEDDAVTITKQDPATIKNSVIVIAPVVDYADERRPRIVNRVPSEDIAEKVINNAEAIVAVDFGLDMDIQSEMLNPDIQFIQNSSGAHP